MGASYSVSVKMAFREKDSKQKAVLALQRMMERTSGGVNYSLDKFAAEGTGTDTFEDLLKIFLGGWKFWDPEIKKGKKWLKYYCDFDASYSWESIMMEMFEEISPFLIDKSEMFIYPDSDYDHLVVKGGKCVQVH